MTNKYLEKAASLSLLALHGLGVHVAQNLALPRMLKTKAVGKYLAKGFHEGASGVIDTGLKHKATSALAGATLPEINNLYSASHGLGLKLKPHLDKMSLKEKVGLKWAAEGKLDKLKHHGLLENPKIQAAKKVIEQHTNIPELLDNVKNSKSTIVTKVVPAIAKNRAVTGTHLIPAEGRSVSAAPGILGAAATSVIDPVTSGLNSFKGLVNSKRFRSTRIGKKVTDLVEHQMVSKPFHKGVEGLSETKLDKVKSVLASPVPLEAKRIGSAFSTKKR